MTPSVKRTTRRISTPARARVEFRTTIRRKLPPPNNDSLAYRTLVKVIEALNIAHVVYSFDYGGLERRILRLIDAMSPLGVNFHVISLRSSRGDFLTTKYPVEHHVLNAKPGIDLPSLFRLARYLRDNDIHIVHSHNWVSMLEGIVGARIARVPIAVHGEHGASRFEPDQLRWRRTVAQRVLSRMADRIIPVNEAIAARIRDVWRLDGGSITTIGNGVDIQRFAPAKQAAGGDIVIGSISRLDPIKNFPCLIKATALLNARQDDKKYRLIIVGGGGEYDPLSRLIDDLNAGDFVELAGPTESPQDWYPKFDLYVNCSFSEGMSNTVLEAMACGLPVVAADVAGHREWLVENENAVFFRSDDPPALASVVRSLEPQARTSMGIANREKVVEFYNQQGFVRNYCRLYEKLLHRKGVSFSFPVGARNDTQPQSRI